MIPNLKAAGSMLRAQRATTSSTLTSNALRTILGSALLAVSFSSSVIAAGDNEAGDVEQGKAKAAVCGACHGIDGNSVNPDWPKLAGQVPGYLFNQLMEFKKGADGNRNNAIMMGQAAILSEADMRNLDEYYASLPAARGNIAEDKAALAEEGGKLYRGGDANMAVPACMGCHGPTGTGVPPTYPNIAGQHAKYLQMQLLSYRAGTRSHNMMTPIAQRLTEQQIEALSWYMQGLD